MLYYWVEREFPVLLPTVNKAWPSIFPDSTTVFNTVSVEDYLFGGFSFCNPDEVSGLEGTLVCQFLKNKTSTTLQVQNDSSITFSFLNYKNGSHDGRFNIWSGVHDLDYLGKITTWNDEEYTGFWGNETTDTCNLVKGRNTPVFPPRRSEDSSYNIFNSEFCRTFSMSYQKDIHYKELKGHRSITDKATFWSAVENPENACFCSEYLNETASCPPSGLNDMTTCLGAPLLLSFPHFLWSQNLFNVTEGLQPNEDDHISFVDIEPVSGIILRSTNRFQYNMEIRPVQNIDVTSKINKTVLPIFWIEEIYDVPNEVVEDLKSNYFDKLKRYSALKWTFLTAGSVMFVGFSVYIFIMYRRRR